MKLRVILPALCFTGLVAAPMAVKPEEAPADRVHPDFDRPIVLAADDVRAFPDAPAGFDLPRANAPHGHVELFEYDSTVTGTRRKASVYLPPDYSPDRQYPVLYLLHGIAGNHDEWCGYIHADTILDNLIAEGDAMPMIVVMPNGRALADDRPPAADGLFTSEHIAGFAKFERDLFECLIPAIQRSYPTYSDRDHVALAGLSMGGGQALNFGFAHLDRFAWVGGFSFAPITKPRAELVADYALARQPFRLLYLSCGKKDQLLSGPQSLHRYLKQFDFPHAWNVDDGGHDRETWANNLHHFAQRIFR